MLHLERSPTLTELALESWVSEGTIAVLFRGLTPWQIAKLSKRTLQRFGTLPIWLHGVKPLPVVGIVAWPIAVEDWSRFDVVLYRRDLAIDRGIRRPWRMIDRR